MKGNPHYDQAADALRDLHMAEAQDGVATLALAFEQRTANLVAFCAMIPRGSMDKDTIRLRINIMERLGLND